MGSQQVNREIIGGWLSESEGVEFIAYAADMGIDSAALATILLVRELNHDRLGGLPDRLGDSLVRKDRRVTARAKLIGFKERFAKHAAKYALSSDAAAATVFRAELRERWLEKCVCQTGNQFDSHS